MSEIPVTFGCEDIALVGVLHAPEIAPSLGFVFVVGGPQYRVGSHRQFVSLARDLAARGAAVLRFDCRGMGDSDGVFPGFELIKPDISAAVDFMTQRLPSVRQVILWGLCDATFAICQHARSDPRISGIVMVNPWVRTDAGQARTQLRHYYLDRLLQRDFIHKFLRGEFNLVKSAREILDNIARALRGSQSAGTSAGTDMIGGTLAERMAENLRHFRGSTLLIVSGRDLTAKEFDDAVRRSKEWRVTLREGRITRREMPDADHTFSRRIWRDQVAAWTWGWAKAVD